MRIDDNLWRFYEVLWDLMRILWDLMRVDETWWGLYENWWGFLIHYEDIMRLYEKGCPRCGVEVFEAEKLIAAKRSWHRRCFICGGCRRHLDSVTVNDGPDGNIYCRACYGARFGMRGYGFGSGAGTLTTVSYTT